MVANYQNAILRAADMYLDSDYKDDELAFVTLGAVKMISAIYGVREDRVNDDINRVFSVLESDN